MSDKDGNAITTPKIPTLKISVKTIVLGVQEHVDDLAPILQQASDALVRLQSPNTPDPPEQAGAAGSAVASVGSILGKIDAIADIMDEVTKVRSYGVEKCALSLMKQADSSLCEGGLEHS